MNTAMQLMPLILLIFIMYFLLIRPQKKREKATTQMRNSLQVGDEIVTIGGICGKIVKLKDESLIIQVGAEKVKFEVMRWSISKIVDSNPNAAGKKARKAPEQTQEEAEKKVMPKKMFKKSQTEETLAEVNSEEVTEEVTEEKIIEIPEEDVEIVKDPSKE